MHVHLNERMCRVNVSDILLRGPDHSRRTKVTYAEFVTTPYLLNPLSNFENISHVSRCVNLNETMVRVKGFRLLAQGQGSKKSMAMCTDFVSATYFTNLSIPTRTVQGVSNKRCLLIFFIVMKRNNYFT